MTAREIVYAGLSLLGLTIPWYFNLQFMQGDEGVVSGFLAAGFANPASSSMTVDLLIACTVFVVWMLREARRLGMRHAWLYFVLTFAVAFAFSYPLFLFMRERRMRAAAPA